MVSSENGGERWVHKVINDDKCQQVKQSTISRHHSKHIQQVGRNFKWRKSWNRIQI